MDFADRLRQWVAQHWGLPATAAATSCPASRAVIGEFILREIATEIARQDGGRLPSLVMPAHEYPLGGPTIVDVLLVSLLQSKGAYTSPKAKILWKPTVSECIEAGCRKAPESVMLVPDFSSELIKAVHGFVPDQIRVQAKDSISSLVSRLTASTFLDDMHVPRAGRTAGYVGRTQRLNNTSMPQPRRVTMSVRVSPISSEGGADTEILFDYKNFKAHEAHKQTRPMPSSIFDLGLACWMAAYDYLPPSSKACPFTHCQLLVYYECFGGRIGQHRDNTSTKHLSDFLSGTTSSLLTALGEEESQVLGTSVVVFSLGTGTMQFILRYPHGDNLHESRKDYIVHERFRVPLGPGTLFVLDPWDDLFFTHEAYFDTEYDNVGESTWREAYVFRHVGSPGMFHTCAENHKLYMSPQIQSKLADRKRARAVAKAKSRRKLFERMM